MTILRRKKGWQDAGKEEDEGEDTEGEKEKKKKKKKEEEEDWAVANYNNKKPSLVQVSSVQERSIRPTSSSYI